MWWVLAISVLMLGYTYAGYPVLIGWLARCRGRSVRKGSFEGGVSVLIAAHNESGTLPAKVANLLELAQSEPIREIWIGLDGCTDGTKAAVESLLRTAALPRIELLEFAQARGKAAVLNDLMGRAGQPIFVMMDARQRVEAGAISKLLESFADPQVGVVSGALVYESVAGGAQKGAESYWSYEKNIRRWESQFWAVPGATGALYAIRKDLCRPIPENTLVDDVLIPMRAVLAGFRCLFEPTARVFDLPSARFDQEGARKRRTLAGIWQLMALEPRIYSILANPIWFQWISHKFLRLLTPFFVLAGFLALGMAAWNGPWGAKWLFGAALSAFFGSLGAFLAGKRLSSRGLGLLGAFFGVNWALLQAAGDAWSGRFEARWKKR